MVGCSNGTIFEVFSVVTYIIVHSGLFKFHRKCVLTSFFQFGARGEGYKTEGMISVLVCQLFESVLSQILVLKLSQ